MVNGYFIMPVPSESPLDETILDGRNGAHNVAMATGCHVGNTYYLAKDVDLTLKYMITSPRLS